MSELGSPVPVQLYSRFMTELFDEKDFIGVPSTFLSLFGRPESGSKTTYQPDKLEIDIDIIRANERMATMVPRGTQAKKLGLKEAKKERFTERNMVFPLGEEESTITANQLFMRRPGENPYEQKTRLQRMREQALDYHKEHVRRMARTFNYLASQAIITGKMPAIIGTTDTGLIYDFKRKATHTWTASVAWTTASTDILGDMDASCNLIRQDASVIPDVCFLGSTAMESILANAAIIALADNRRFQQASIVTDQDCPKKYMFLQDAGWNFRGILKTPQGYSLHLFSSVEGYDNAAGTFTKFIGDEQCVIGSTEARCDRLFGPPERLPMMGSEVQFFQELFGFSPSAPPMPGNIKNGSMVISPEMFFFDARVSEDRKNVVLRTQTAPIFSPIHTDAWVTIDITP